MNVDDFLYAERIQLNDPIDATNNPSQKWSDAEIVNHGSFQCQHLARIQIDRGRNFHNTTIVLQAAAAKQLYTDAWQFTLPAWCAAAVNVYELNPGTDAVNELNNAPLAWLPAAAKLQALRKLEKMRRGIAQGYTWDGVYTLRVWGYTYAPKLALDIAKIPPPLFKGTLEAAPASSTSKLYLPSTLTYGREAMVEGEYINALVQCTQSTDLANFGVMRRCVYSKAATDVGGFRKHELWFDEPWPAILKQNDVVQTLIPFGDSHTRALVLLTAQACLQKEGNLPILKAIAGELSTQLASFVAFAARKDNDGPDIIESDFGTTSISDDRSPRYAWGNQ